MPGHCCGHDCSFYCFNIVVLLFMLLMFLGVLTLLQNVPQTYCRSFACFLKKKGWQAIYGYIDKTHT